MEIVNKAGKKMTIDKSLKDNFIGKGWSEVITPKTNKGDKK